MRLRNRNTLIRVIFDQCSKLYSRICSRMFFGRSDKQRAPVIFQHCYSTDGQEPIKTVDKKRCKRLRNTNAHGSFLGCLDVEIRFFMLPVSGSRRRVLTLFTSRCFLLFPSFSLFNLFRNIKNILFEDKYLILLSFIFALKQNADIRLRSSGDCAIIFLRYFFSINLLF